MTHALSWDKQPTANTAETDSVLERQLEQLFSDAILPEPVSVPRPTGRIRRPNFKWAIVALVALATLALLGTMPALDKGSASAGLVNGQTLTDMDSPPSQPTYENSSTTPTASAASPAKILAAATVPATPTPSPPTPTRATAAAVVVATNTARPTPTPKPTLTATIADTAAPTANATSTTEPTATATSLPPDPAKASPSRLVIPSIALDAPILTVGFVNFQVNGQTVSSWDVPATTAAGWHHTSALPGQVGNTVLNGHQNIYGAVFRKLGALQTGDEIIVYAGDAAHHYRVSERHLLQEEGQPLAVRAANARWILPTGDERLTLVTCAPDTKSTHRLIVVALPVGPAPTSTPM